SNGASINTVYLFFPLPCSLKLRERERTLRSCISFDLLLLASMHLGRCLLSLRLLLIFFALHSLHCKSVYASIQVDLLLPTSMHLVLSTRNANFLALMEFTRVPNTFPKKDLPSPQAASPREPTSTAGLGRHFVLAPWRAEMFANFRLGIRRGPLSDVRIINCECGNTLTKITPGMRKRPFRRNRNNILHT
ncbi:Hypothetical predicted protein, partial [Drosophila guanche]